jgi:hypothetical protein
MVNIGPSQSVVWDTAVPSKKRTCAGRLKHSSVEKLTKDLCTILHEQQQSCFSTSSEEELLFESETPVVSVEIGHGSMLIRHPSSIARDEESEASSLSVDNKQCLMNEAYSCYGSIPMLSDYIGMNFSSQGVAKVRNSAGQRMQQEQFERYVSLHMTLVSLPLLLVSYVRVSINRMNLVFPQKLYSMYTDTALTKTLVII